MSGLGGVEVLIILLIVAVLFGPTLLAFWLGYVLGRRKSAEQPLAPAGPRSTADTPPAPAPVAPTPSSAPPVHDDTTDHTPEESSND